MAGVGHIALEVVDPGREMLREERTAGTMLGCGVRAAFAEPDEAPANGGTFTSKMPGLTSGNAAVEIIGDGF